MRRHEPAEIRERPLDEREPQLTGEAAAAGLNRLRIPIDREHATFSTQGLENPCRVTAAAVRRIDIITTRLDGQSGHRLIDEHRLVLALRLVHESKRLETAPLKRNRIEQRRQIRRACVALQELIALLVPARLVPQLEAAALTDQHSEPLQPRDLAQLRRQ